MKLKVGSRELEMDGEQLTELRSSNDIFHDVQALRDRMEEDGYLLIRGFHDRDKVMQARTNILEKMKQMGKLDRDTQLEDGVMADGSKTIFFGGTNDDLPALLNVLNGEHIMRFFDEFLGE